MPGAYAHITSVYHLISGNKLDATNLSNFIKHALDSYPEFCILGAVSPDYPYLDLKNKNSCEWADAIHHGGMDHLLRHGVTLIRNMPSSDEKMKCLAWFMGFTAHVGMDMTIHPIVEGVAGIYSESKENQRKHRLCEMHQDVHIWQRLNVGTIGRGEVIDNIRLCTEPDTLFKLYEPVRSLWNDMLAFAYSDLYRRHKPNINAWHSMFPTVVDTVEESHQWPKFARHVAVNAGMSYPTPDEIDTQYIKGLSAPDGQKYDYDVIFERGLSHVTDLWRAIGDAIENNTNSSLEILGDWNLDRGLKSSGEYVFWAENIASQAQSG